MGSLLPAMMGLLSSNLGKGGLANFSSLADPGCFSRIPDPNISHPGSTIKTAPDLQQKI
jgi:hypothetical protein